VKNYNKIARQAGMTLIELTVVLLVLVGLAGLMIPYVTGFIGKTHDATGSSNTKAIGSAITRFENSIGRYPDNLDSLISGAGATGGSLIDYTMCDVMPNMMCTDAATDYGFTALDLSAVDAAGSILPATANGEVCGSLMKAGIDNVIDMNVLGTTGFNATFANSLGSVPLGNAMAQTCVGMVVGIDAANVATAFGIDTTNKQYVIFGMGQGSELIGKTVQEAPVHFAKDATYNASQAYNRFGVVFEVDNDVATVKASVDAMRAKYVGTVMLMNKVVGLQSELASYYTSATDEAN